MIPAKTGLTRLVSGNHSGSLRVTVEVTLSPYEETCFAKAVGAGTEELENLRANLQQKKRSRSVGSVAADVSSVMINRVYDLVAKGATK